MKIFPANSEGCWLFIFVIFLSFGVCIFLSFLFLCCLVVFYFLALFIFLSFSHKDQASGEGGKPGLGNAKKCKITLLRVIPTMTFIHFLTGKSSGILSDISSDILFGILSGISSVISSGIIWQIFWHSIWHIFWHSI